MIKMVKAKKAARVQHTPEQPGTGPVILEDKGPVKKRRFTFTYNNYTADDRVAVIDFLRKEAVLAIFGEETAPTTGTEHLQGYFEVKNPRSWENLRQVFPWHLEIAKKVRHANINYCKKECRNVYTQGIENKWSVPDPLEGVTLRDWQTQLEERLNSDPDPRMIIWVYDPIGNGGKSTWCKSWRIRHPNDLKVSGKVSDAINVLWQRKDAGQDPPRVVFWDFPRAQKMDHISYPSIEAIKDGDVVNTKYKCENLMFPRPWVVILSNSLPDTSTMSQDRWEIVQISNPIF